MDGRIGGGGQPVSQRLEPTVCGAVVDVLAAGELAVHTVELGLAAIVVDVA